MYDEYQKKLISEHTKLLKNFDYPDIIADNDPDILRMNKIIKEVQELKENEED